jgi:hypothetical protein
LQTFKGFPEQKSVSGVIAKEGITEIIANGHSKNKEQHSTCPENPSSYELNLCDQD